MCENSMLPHAGKMEALGPFQIRGRQINELGMWLLSPSSWLNYLSCSSCALSLGTQAWWNSDLAGGLVPSLRLPTCSWTCPLLLMGSFAGNMGMRELSGEFHFKKQGKVKVNMKSLSRVRLCDPIDCSLPGSSVHGIFQAIVLEWIAISFSRRSSQPRARTRVSHIVDRRFTVWATREVQKNKEDVNKWDTLGRKIISIWGKDLSTFHSYEAFLREKWLVQRAWSVIICLQVTETHSD